jgi:hypothetical protein
VWTDPTEVRQAVDLLPLWADIDVDDALELLGKDFANRHVRAYAVSQLRKADDDVRITSHTSWRRTWFKSLLPYFLK